jgi:hypothetical protein
MFDVSRYKDVEYLVIMEAKNNPQFKSELLQPGNAKNAIEKKFKISLPAEVGIRAIQDERNKFTIVLPPEGAEKVIDESGTLW